MQLKTSAVEELLKKSLNNRTFRLKSFATAQLLYGQECLQERCRGRTQHCLVCNQEHQHQGGSSKSILGATRWVDRWARWALDP